MRKITLFSYSLVFVAFFNSFIFGDLYSDIQNEGYDLWGQVYDENGDLHLIYQKGELDNISGIPYWLDSNVNQIEKILSVNQSTGTIDDLYVADTIIELFYKRQLMMGYSESGAGSYNLLDETYCIPPLFLGEDVQQRSLTDLSGYAYHYYIPRFFDQRQWYNLNPYHINYIEGSSLTGFDNYSVRVNYWKELIGSAVFFEIRDEDARQLVKSTKFFDEFIRICEKANIKIDVIEDFKSNADNISDILLQQWDTFNTDLQIELLTKINPNLPNTSLDAVARYGHFKAYLNKNKRHLSNFGKALKAFNIATSLAREYYDIIYVYAQYSDISNDRYSALCQYVSSSSFNVDEAFQQALWLVGDALDSYKNDVMGVCVDATVNIATDELLGLTVEYLTKKAIKNIFGNVAGVYATLMIHVGIESAQTIDQFYDEVRYMSLAAEFERRMHAAFADCSHNEFGTEVEGIQIVHAERLMELRLIAAKMFYGYFHDRLSDHGIFHVTFYQGNEYDLWSNSLAQAENSMLNIWFSNPAPQYFASGKVDKVKAKLTDRLESENDIIISHNGPWTTNIGDIFAISGSVTQTGIGVSGAQIEAVLAMTGAVLGTATTNSTGQYAMNSVALSVAGTYDINLYATYDGRESSVCTSVMVNNPAEGYDLAINSVTCPATANPDGNVSVNVNVMNSGVNNASGSLTVKLYYPNGSLCDSETKPIPTLSPTYINSQNVNLSTSSTEGSYSLEVSLSTFPGDEDLTNNTQVRTIYVGSSQDIDGYKAEEWWVESGDCPTSKQFGNYNIQVTGFNASGGSVSYITTVINGSVKKLYPGDFYSLYSGQLAIYFESGGFTSYGYYAFLKIAGADSTSDLQAIPGNQSVSRGQTAEYRLTGSEDIDVAQAMEGWGNGDTMSAIDSDISDGLDRLYRINTLSLSPGDYEWFVFVEGDNNDYFQRLRLTVLAPHDLVVNSVQSATPDSVTGDPVDFQVNLSVAGGYTEVALIDVQITGPSGYIHNLPTQSLIFSGTTSANFLWDTLNCVPGVYNVTATGQIASDANSGNNSASCTVTLNAPPFYTVSINSPENGQVVPSIDQTVTAGVNISFVATPHTGYLVDEWYLDSSPTGVSSNEYFLLNVQQNHDLEVYFKIKTYTVAITASSGGTVFPEGTVGVDYNGSLTIDATPDSGFLVDSWYVNGSLYQNGGTSLTLSNITENRTVNVIFEPETVLVPDLTGLTETEAEAQLDSAGLLLGSTIQGYTPSVDQGLVIRSLPSAGETVVAGSSVQIVICDPVVVDLNADNEVNLFDFALFSDSWGLCNCNDLNSWCNGADLDRSGCADIYDMVGLSSQWIKKSLPQPIAHYTFSGDACDTSGNAHDGIVHGATATIDRYGNPNSAYRFDGVDDYIEIESTNKLRVEYYTLCMWIKTPGASVRTNPFSARFTHSGTNSSGFELVLSPDGTIKSDNMTYIWNNFGASSQSTIANDDWQHIAFTWDGTESTVFVNGEFEYKIDPVKDLGYPSYNYGPIYWYSGFYQNFMIGYSHITGDYFTGSIDDIRFYDTPLSTNQIYSIFLTESEPQNSSLLAHYPFSGNATDASDNGYDGEIYGNVIFEDDVDGQHVSLPGSISSYINFDDSEIFDPGTASFSVALWFKAASVSGGQFMLSKGNSHSTHSGWSIWLNDDEISIRGNGENQECFGLSKAGIVPGRWYHMVMIIDRNNGLVKGYLNASDTGWTNVIGGVTMTTALTESAVISSTNSMVMGYRVGNNDCPYNGCIDDLRIYGEVLSETEIQNLYGQNSKSLVAYYPFSGDATDASGNDLDATVYNAILTTDRFGDSEKAYYFDGNDDYLRVSDVALDVSDFTVSLWLYADEIPSYYKMSFSIHSGGGGINWGDRNISLVYGNTGNLSFFYSTSDGQQGINPPTTSIDPGEWYHVVILREGHEQRLYLNGVLEDSYTDTLGAFSMTNGFIDIGAPNYWAGGWSLNGRDQAKWKGKIDEVRIYESALADDEIMNIVYASSDTSHTEPYFDTYAASSYSQITYSGGSFSVRSRDGYSMLITQSSR